MSLHPDETLQRHLISSTSQIIGEFESEGLLIKQAGPPSYDLRTVLRWYQGPTSRTALVVSFRTVACKKKSPGEATPDYSSVGEAFASHLSVLYGKRFDRHGLVQSAGFFGVPDVSHFSISYTARDSPHSREPRSDYPIPLDLTELRRIAPLLPHPLAQSCLD